MAVVHASLLSSLRFVWSSVSGLMPACLTTKQTTLNCADNELDNGQTTNKIREDSPKTLHTTDQKDDCPMTADEGDILSLTDDELFTIFSFMSLMDRGRVARVCKRWKRIVKDSRLWTNINFWQKTPCLRNPWTNERHSLRLMETYANSGLRTIHLRVVTMDVLLFLRQNCPNIKVFSFWPPSWPRGLALDSRCRPVPHFPKNLIDNLTDSVQVPETAVKVQLTFMGVESPFGGSFVDLECGDFTETLMFRLSFCRHLRHLTLAHCHGLKTQGLVTLTEAVPELEELWLFNFEHQATENDTLLSVLRCIAKNLTKLKSFRFITAQLDVDFDEFFYAISKRGTLKQLWIGRGPYCFSEETFAVLCHSLPNLEELVLESCNCVTDAVIECIGRELRKLKLLNLLASGPYTSQSTTHLHKHPTLEITNVSGLTL